MASTPPVNGSSSEAAGSGRFTSQASTAEDLLKSQTVGLVHLSDFRKRRAEAIDQKERLASNLSRFTSSAQSTRPNSGTATPTSNDEGGTTPVERPKKKRKPVTKGKLSFGVDDEEPEDDGSISQTKPGGNTPKDRSAPSSPRPESSPAPDSTSDNASTSSKHRLGPNTSVAVAPRALTKSALRVESLTRETLRRDFLAMQEAVRSTPIHIPFVFYDGTNTPGGICTIKKGDHIWLFLDRARKAGARLGVSNNSDKGHDQSGTGGGSAGASERVKGANKNRSHWARIGVDDLLLVRGEIIIPHHYDIYYFIVNKTLGSNSKPLFDYSSTAPTTSKIPSSDPSSRNGTPTNPETEGDGKEPEPYNPLSTSSNRRRKDDSYHNDKEEENESLEGANDDPNFTKVVDRRWYERNKHIFPASMWEEYDPGKVYEGRVRKDQEGNVMFFS